jgi:hypothetical protein
VLEAYDTPAFGLYLTRSEESKNQLQRLAELNVRELRGKLSSKERAEQESLRATLPTTAHVVEVEAGADAAR